jgi:hypothetical protein
LELDLKLHHFAFPEPQGATSFFLPDLHQNVEIFKFLQYTREGKDGGVAGATSFCLPGAGVRYSEPHHFDAAPARQNDQCCQVLKRLLRQLNKILPLFDKNTPGIQIFKKSATFPLFVAFNFALTVEN